MSLAHIADLGDRARAGEGVELSAELASALASAEASSSGALVLVGKRGKKGAGPGSYKKGDVRNKSGNAGGVSAATMKVATKLSKSKRKKIEALAKKKEKEGKRKQLYQSLKESSLDAAHLDLLADTKSLGQRATTRQTLRSNLKLQRAGIGQLQELSSHHAALEQRRDELPSAATFVQEQSGRRLYVCNINFELTEAALREAFSKWGAVAELELQRGFAFVCFEQLSAARLALGRMDGAELLGRKIKVSVASDDAALPSEEDEVEEEEEEEEEDEGEEEEEAEEVAAEAAEQGAEATPMEDEASAPAAAPAASTAARANALMWGGGNDLDDVWGDEAVEKNAARAAVAKAKAGAPLAQQRPDTVAVSRLPEVQANRMELPICGMEQEIMEAVRNHPVVIVCGETGSGKTTQVPQFLFEAGFGAPGSSRPGMVGVTQPRRVAAVASARRIAYELNEPWETGSGGRKRGRDGTTNGKCRVGFQIRYEGKNVGDHTRIKCMTDGILLRELQTDFLLRRYSAVVLDEAHERNLNTDILIGLLSRVLPLRRTVAAEEAAARAKMSAAERAAAPPPLSPLTLVIMSATLRVEDFSSPHLFGASPPVIMAQARQHPVTVHFNKRTALDDYVDAAHKKVCKIHKQLPPGGILIFVTGEDEIRQMVEKLKGSFSKHRVRAARKARKARLEQAHQRGNDRQSALAGEAGVAGAAGGVGSAGAAAPSWDDLVEEAIATTSGKVAAVSGAAATGAAAAKAAAAKAEERKQKKELAQEEKAKRKKQAAKVLDPYDDDGEAEGGEDCDFEGLSGSDSDDGVSSSSSSSSSDEEEERDLEEEERVIAAMDEESSSGSSDSDDSMDSDSGDDEPPATPMHVLPLFSRLSSAAQMRVFQDVPKGCRMVVVATNVAETSITIPGIRYVVDTGRAKEKAVDLATGITSFDVGFASQASCNQRAGRAGRTGPGHCYRLFSSAVFDQQMTKFAVPEVERLSLCDVVLHMKLMGITKIASFPFPSPPNPLALRIALLTLRNLGAIAGGSDGAITPLGTTLASLPLSPQYARMLVAGRARGSLKLAVALVAGVSLESPFIFANHASPMDDGGGKEGEGEEEEEEEEEPLVVEAKEQEVAKKGREANPWTHPKSDALAVLRAAGAYAHASGGTAAAGVQRMHNAEASAAFCTAHMLHDKTMLQILQLTTQLTRIVNSTFAPEPSLAADSVFATPPDAQQESVLQQLVLSGLLENVAMRVPVGAIVEGSRFERTCAYQSCNPSIAEPLYVHPGSGLFTPESKQLPDFVVFRDIVRTSK